MEFLLPEVEYLGHKISQDGLRPTEEKIKAIRDAPKPVNVSQLKAFLGLLNYCGKFLPNLSSILALLYSLLQKQTTWHWGVKQQRAFVEAKELVSSSPYCMRSTIAARRNCSFHVMLHLVAWGLFCHTRWKMGQRGPLHLLPELLPRLNIIILSLIRRVWPLCSG